MFCMVGNQEDRFSQFDTERAKMLHHNYCCVHHEVNESMLRGDYSVVVCLTTFS